MGSSGTDTPSKASKASAPQEQQPPATSGAATPSVYPDWSSFQAYPPIPPHGFFPSPVASSPQGHPYMWGAQPMIPPYGTPPPPYVMYPPGVYAHPSMPPGAHPFTPYAMTSPNGNADATGTAAAAGDTDGKPSEAIDKSPTKRPKGSLGSLNMLTGKNPTEHGKTSGASANGATSQSGETGSESSSEGSEGNSQNDSHKGSGQEHDGDVRSSQNGASHSASEGKSNQTMAIMPSSGTGAGPTTNLNIGMDYWANTASSTPAIHGKVTPTTVPGAVVPAEQWIQDERELKRQRRKQSNRESARRSRLRKQAECEELAQRADVLKQENASLRDEVNRIRKEYEELLSKNNSLKEKLEGKQHKTDEAGLNKLQHSGDDNQKKGN